MNKTAQTLRQRGFNVEQYHEDRKLNAQLKYAEGKAYHGYGFPVNVDGEHQVKNSVSREQQPADPATWMPGKGKYLFFWNFVITSSHNWHQIDDQLYRSAQAYGSYFDYLLKQNKIKSLINLRGENPV